MKRPILWSTIFTICGIYMRLGISEMVCLASFVCIGILLSHFVIKLKIRKAVLLLLFAVLGFFVADAAQKRKTPCFTTEIAVQGTAVVRQTGETTTGNQKLTMFGDVQTEAGETLQDVKLYAVWSGEERLAVGDIVSYIAEAAPYTQSPYPGGYDEAFYLTVKGFDGKIYPEAIEKTGEDSSAAIRLEQARAHLREVLENILPEEESGIMKAMLTGEREDLADDVYDLYTRAGVVHILCISGLHMSILALSVVVFMEKVLQMSRRASAAGTILVCALFLMFTGLTPSACRAVLMISLVMLGRILFQLTDRLNNIAIAALVLLLIEPLYLFHVGFQLSFITVIGICIAAERLEKQGKREKSVLTEIKEILYISFYASLFSFPAVAYHFDAVSLVGILANLVILPLSGYLLGFGMLSAFLGLFFLPAGIFAAGSVYVILRIYKWTCTLLTSVPYGYFLIGKPSLTTILCMYLLLFFVLLYGERKHAWKGAAVLCCGLWFSIFGNRMLFKENTVAFLNVGQGDAAVLSAYDGRTYLIDGGGQYGKDFGSNTGEWILLPYLQSLGVTELDGVFLSHPDTDHMTGLLEVLEKMPTKGLYLSEYPFADTEEWRFLEEFLTSHDIPLYAVKNGDVSADGAWECLYPFDGVAFSDDDDNHGSMVLRYTYGGTSILFTGDIAQTDEKLLLSQGADLSADILKVAHHGSKYSSSEAFLEAVSPKIAVISCGKNNLYGHPHEETMGRLSAETESIHRTDLHNSVIVNMSSDGSYAVKTLTEQKPVFERWKAGMMEKN